YCSTRGVFIWISLCCVSKPEIFRMPRKMWPPEFPSSKSYPRHGPRTVSRSTISLRLMRGWARFRLPWESAAKRCRAISPGRPCCPNDTSGGQELMLAYAHVGDTLGNAAYDNFGDAAGALAEYTKMAAIARTLHEADPNDVRGISDYGIALLRAGIVTPMEQR